MNFGRTSSAATDLLAYVLHLWRLLEHDIGEAPRLSDTQGVDDESRSVITG